LDLPSVVLIKDELQRNVIQQRSIFELLTKFDGKTKTFVPTTRENRTHVIVQLPRYLIVHFRRFTKNQWFAEKNRTIVNFPLKYLDLKDCPLFLPTYLIARPALTRFSLLLVVQLPAGVTASRYNLVTNIRHDGDLNNGTYSLHVFHKSINKWYNVQDLTIDETEAEPIAISEAYIQVYERSDV
jgi:U4/U6.U5 tri-snRNP-associated protein 2